jgi:hypothetical protein
VSDPTSQALIAHARVPHADGGALSVTKAVLEAGQGCIGPMGTRPQWEVTNVRNPVGAARTKPAPARVSEIQLGIGKHLGNCKRHGGERSKQRSPAEEYYPCGIKPLSAPGVANVLCNDPVDLFIHRRD